MGKEKEKILEILLKFANSDSTLKQVPPEYVIHLPREELQDTVLAVLSSPDFDQQQKEKLKMILLINDILICIKNDEKDKIEAKLINLCKDFIELLGFGSQLR